MKIYKLSKKDKLKSRKTIEQLFKNGKTVSVFPLKLIYIKTTPKDNAAMKAAFSVSKKLHKSAVARNRIKRLLRESYRLQKPCHFNNDSASYALMILYLSHKGTTFAEINACMPLLIKKFLAKTQDHEKANS